MIIDNTIPLKDTFKKLTKEQQQKVVNYTMDSVIGKFKDYKFAYHGYANDNPNSKATNYSK